MNSKLLEEVFKDKLPRLLWYGLLLAILFLTVALWVVMSV